MLNDTWGNAFQNHSHPPTTGDGGQVELVIDWEGDVAQLRSDGIVVRDRFCAVHSVDRVLSARWTETSQ